MSSEVVVYGKRLDKWVDARDLHARLGSGRQFSNWMQAIVSAFDLKEGQDFRVVFNKTGGNSEGRPRNDFEFALLTAKLIALSARGPQAIEARRYLVELEEKWNDLVGQWNSEDAIIARGLELATAKIARLEARFGELEKKGVFHDQYMDAKGSVEIASIANTAHAQGFDIGKNRLFAFLKYMGVLVHPCRPAQEQLDVGHFEVKQVTYKRKVAGKEETFIHPQPLVPAKGVKYILALIESDYSSFLPVWREYGQERFVNWAALRRKALAAL